MIIYHSNTVPFYGNIFIYINFLYNMTKAIELGKNEVRLYHNVNNIFKIDLF